MIDADELFRQVAQHYGLRLSFNDRDMCVLVYRDAAEILVALRGEGRALTLATELVPVRGTPAADFFDALLRQNLTGLLGGPFYFSLDGQGRRVLLTGLVPLAAATADTFMDTLRKICASRERLSTVVDAMQTDALSYAEALQALTRDIERLRPASDPALLRNLMLRV